MMTTEEWNDKPRGKEYGADKRDGFDAVYLAESAAARIEELEAENFALAAQQCLFSDGSGLCGDEWGHQYCAMKRRAEAAEAIRSRIPPSY